MIETFTFNIFIEQEMFEKYISIPASLNWVKTLNGATINTRKCHLTLVLVTSNRVHPLVTTTCIPSLRPRHYSLCVDEPKSLYCQCHRNLDLYVTDLKSIWVICLSWLTCIPVLGILVQGVPKLWSRNYFIVQSPQPWRSTYWPQNKMGHPLALPTCIPSFEDPR